MKHTVYYLHTNIQDSEWYTLHPSEDALKEALEDTIREHRKRNGYKDKELSALLKAGEIYEAWDLWKIKHLGDYDFTHFDDQVVEFPDPAPPEHPPQIVITVEGGVIQDIANIPKDTDVVIVDFDTEGADEDQLTPSPWSKDGTECIIRHYGFGSKLPHKDFPL